MSIKEFMKAYLILFTFLLPRLFAFRLAMLFSLPNLKCLLIWFYILNKLNSNLCFCLNCFFTTAFVYQSFDNPVNVFKISLPIICSNLVVIKCTINSSNIFYMSSLELQNLIHLLAKVIISQSSLFF